MLTACLVNHEGDLMAKSLNIRVGEGRRRVLRATYVTHRRQLGSRCARRPRVRSLRGGMIDEYDPDRRIICSALVIHSYAGTTWSGWSIDGS